MAPAPCLAYVFGSGISVTPSCEEGMCYRIGLVKLINAKWNDLCPGGTAKMAPAPSSLSPAVALTRSWAVSNSSSLKIPSQLLTKPVNLKIPTAPIQGLFPQHRALVCKQWAEGGDHPSSGPRSVTLNSPFSPRMRNPTQSLVFFLALKRVPN